MGLRVAGTDPGTSSLDVLVLDNGTVSDQCRFAAEKLRADPAAPVRWLERRGPFALVAAPSGYGLPLVRASTASARERWLLSLVHTDKGEPSCGSSGRGVPGFSQLVEAFCTSPLPAVFLPGVIHLNTVPVHRKFNRIDLGTADKLCVSALALHLRSQRTGRAAQDCSFCLVELGSAFTACMLIDRGRIVDGIGGTCGALGWQSGGAWDGEIACLLGPVSKSDLFTGGAGQLPLLSTLSPANVLAESVVRVVAGMLAVTDVPEIVLSGRLLETEEIAITVEQALARLRPVVRLESLPGAWVKHAAQGSALIADALASGQESPLDIAGASGTVLDWIVHPRLSQRLLDSLR